jgi:nanoRNase/pAp phosphatase (c-di-AMP/oligoRNAs hydrolase)
MAMERFELLKDVAFVHMEEIDNPDTLVIIADFFMKLAEVKWCVISGTFNDKLVIVLRNAGLRGDAGKIAQKLIGHWHGSAGGHKDAARAEIDLADIRQEGIDESGIPGFVKSRWKSLKWSRVVGR